MPLPDRLTQLGQRASTIATMLGIAREMAVARRPVDLTGIEDAIGAACAQALDLPPDQARRAAPLLARIGTALDRLESTLTNHPPAPCG